MRITLERTHDAKVDDLVELLTTSEGLQRMPPELVESPVVEDHDPPGHTRVRWSQRFELGPGESPSRLMSHQVRVEVAADWTSGERRAVGTITTRISGAPVHASAVHVIEPTDDGCRSTLEVDLSSHVAMLGGRLLASIERIARRQLQEFLDALDLGLSAQPR
jgi:hypothetical protein